MTDFEKYNLQYEEPKSTLFQMLDKNGHILYVNNKWLEEMGYSLDEVIGRFFGEFITKDNHSVVEKNLPSLVDYGFVNNVSLKLKRKDGVIIETVLNGISVYDELGNFINTRCEIRNLNYFMESSKYVQGLLKKERFLKNNLHLKSQITQAILYSDTLNQFLISVAEIFKDSFGIMGIYLSTLDTSDKRKNLFVSKSDHPFSEVMTKFLNSKKKISKIEDKTYIVDSNSKDDFYEEVNSQLGENESLVILPIVSNKKISLNKVDFFIHLKDLSPFEQEWLVFLKDLKTTISLGINTFETNENLKNTLNKLYQLSTRDSLTDTYNRYEFEKSIKESINIFERYNNVFSIIMYDIDNFKIINDTFGHIAGDNILKDLSKLVIKEIRGIDKLFRLGGDEFIILLPESDKNHAFRLAERLKNKISSFNFSGINITCSFGVTEVKEEDILDKIMNRSDNAMYISKKSNKNKVSII